MDKLKDIIKSVPIPMKEVPIVPTPPTPHQPKEVPEDILKKILEE